MTKKMSFESALAKLEKIVQEMESRDLPLENALAKFEEGMKLSRQCADMLEEVEKKVSVILAGSGQDEKPAVAPFETEHQEDLEEDGV